MQQPSIVRISPKDLRAKFNNNEGGYPLRIKELSRVTIYDRLASPRSGQPKGTRSVLYEYRHKGRKVMLLHCFQLPSGELGGSGKMDPKALLVGNTLFTE